MELSMRDKSMGAFIGAVIGDALGWPNEQNSNCIKGSEYKNSEKGFSSWEKRCGGRYYPYIDKIDAGSYSDDGQLLIATARSLISDNWINCFTKIELPLWISYERGGGGATLRASKKWLEGKSPWDISNNIQDRVKYFNAGGNGAAMRILPHIIYNLDNKKQGLNQVFINSICTHGHPRAIVGALLYADALYYLFESKDIIGYGELIDYLIVNKDEWSSNLYIKEVESWRKSIQFSNIEDYLKIWKETVDETINLLKIAKEALSNGLLDITEKTLEELKCFDRRVNGAGHITTVISLYLTCKFASSPELGIIEASNLSKSDNDTICSMMGGLIGAIHGTSFINREWVMVQDYEYIINLVEKLSNKEKVNILSNIEAWTYDIDKSFKKTLHMKSKNHILELPSIGILKIIDKEILKSNIKNKNVIRFKVKSHAGQTLYFTDFTVKEEGNDIKREEKYSNKKNKVDRYILINNIVTEFLDVLHTRMTAKKFFELILLIVKECEVTDNESIVIESLTKETKQFIYKNKIDESLVNDIISIITKE